MMSIFNPLNNLQPPSIIRSHWVHPAIEPVSKRTMQELALAIA